MESVKDVHIQLSMIQQSSNVYVMMDCNIYLDSVFLVVKQIKSKLMVYVYVFQDYKELKEFVENVQLIVCLTLLFNNVCVTIPLFRKMISVFLGVRMDNTILMVNVLQTVLMDHFTTTVNVNAMMDMKQSMEFVYQNVSNTKREKMEFVNV
jgi:hypothetical protein